MADRLKQEQFVVIEKKLDPVMASLEARFDAIDRRFEEIVAGIAGQRAYTDAAFERVASRLDRWDARIARVERKLDQFIDVQSRTNELVERRLTRLER